VSNPAVFNNPGLVAVWPGMGQVAISAGYYLGELDRLVVFQQYEDRVLDLFKKPE